jgi:hypothetical protein
MSDKRNESGEAVDPRVSAAYRDMANERSPEHLDHIILNAARAAAKPRWNNAVAWLRPAAWVATIGVCLAIVVEVALLPEPETADIAPVSDAPPAAPAAEARRLEKIAPQAAEPARARPVMKPSGGVSASRQQRLEEAKVLDRAREMEQQVELDEDLAPAGILQSAPAAASTEEFAVERYCDVSQTADPNTWLECILELERQGLHDAARIERELLVETFPQPELARPPDVR